MHGADRRLCHRPPYIGIGDASAIGLQAYLNEAQAAATQSLDDIRQVCTARGVTFDGDTIERNATYEGILPPTARPRTAT